MKRRKNLRVNGHPKTPEWTPFQEGHYPPEHEKLLQQSKGFVGVFRNSRYQVEMNEMASDFGPITWLAIVRLDREAIHDWRDLQRIKNELMGDEREACEIFPAESRLVDTSNNYHLFVLPEGQCFPFGYMTRDVSDGTALGVSLNGSNRNKQRPFETSPDGLNDRVKTGEMTVPIFGGPATSEKP
jgi:hypothetical protein